MYKIVYSLRLAQKLCKQGFRIIEVRPNPKKPWLNCFLFEDSESLRVAIEEATKND